MTQHIRDFPQKCGAPSKNNILESLLKAPPKTEPNLRKAPPEGLEARQTRTVKLLGRGFFRKKSCCCRKFSINKGSLLEGRIITDYNMLGSV